MQHQRVAGQHAGDLFQPREVQPGLARELVGPVAGADGDGQRIAAGALHEVHGLVGVGVHRMFGGHFVLHARQLAQFRFHPHAARVGVFDDLLRDGDVLFVRQVRAVVHDRGEAAVDAVLADVEVLAVVKVQHHRQVGVQQGRLDELHDVVLPGVLARPGGNLKDQRGLFLAGRLHDALDDLHVVHVEGADGVPFLVGPLEHLLGTGQRHGVPPAGAGRAGCLLVRLWKCVRWSRAAGSADAGGGREPGMPSEGAVGADPSAAPRKDHGSAPRGYASML